MWSVCSGTGCCEGPGTSKFASTDYPTAGEKQEYANAHPPPPPSDWGWSHLGCTTVDESRTHHIEPVSPKGGKRGVQSEQEMLEDRARSLSAVLYQPSMSSEMVPSLRDLIQASDLVAISYCPERLCGSADRASRVSTSAAKDPIKGVLAALGFELDQPIGSGGLLLGYIAHSSSDIVLAYSGLLEPSLVRTVEKVQFAPATSSQKQRGCCGCCRRSSQSSTSVPSCNRGIVEAFHRTKRAVDAHLIPLLKKPPGTVKRLIVCGHGTGGALALAALGYLLQKFDFSSSPLRLLCVTFGSPRMHDAAGASWLENQMAKLSQSQKDKFVLARVVKDAHLLPLLAMPGNPFKHVSKAFYIDAEGELFLNADLTKLDIPESKADMQSISVKPSELDNQVVKAYQQLKQAYSLPLAEIAQRK
mmetsp:Transcript_14366/g.26420  ORF Transcript_14366/g.26420 Transcript_14366/m.26420 type:complete len:417 (-) Transcript_14366:97-1347(-)